MKLKEFFYFNKSDRSVLVFLVVVAMVLACLFYGLGDRQEWTEAETEDSLRSEGRLFRDRKDYFSGERGQGSYGYGYAPETELFTFDPNTADSTTLLRLGLAPWQVRNIYKYRSRGGVYRTKQDFARLYGLTVEKYRELEPYIQINGDYRPAAELYGDDEAPTYERDTLKYPIKLKHGEYVVLNIADTTTLKKVPGIGSYYARQIMNYGLRLGGYVSVAQLREVGCVPEETFSYFRVDSLRVKKLNLNTLTLNQLKAHPYIDFFQARAICDYRRMNGPLKSLEDLKLLKEFPPQVRQRLRPYVEF